MSQRSRARCARAAGLAASLWLAACTASGDGAVRPPVPGRDAVVISSFNFPENALVAEIYAQALEAADVPVRREFLLGPRELVLPALQQGQLDVVPEYLGTALTTVGADVAAARDPTSMAALLTERLAGWHLRPLRPAAASNNNGFAVTRATADRLGLRTISDLRPVAQTLKLGGPPECPTRPLCASGLAREYGVRFGTFVPLETEKQRVTALVQQVVDVAVVFTTDGRLADRELQLLGDDRRLQPPENIVPVVSQRVLDRYGTRVPAALDAVSAQLDTSSLIVLNWRVEIAGKRVADEARGWLLRHGLVTAVR